MSINSAPNSFRLIILTDSLPSSGQGHARRCLALCREFNAAGVHVTYALLAGSTTGIFKDSGVFPVCLPPNPSPMELASYLDHDATSMLIVDTYLLQKSFIEELIQIYPTLPVLAFDDYGEKADWPILGVLNPGLGANTISYPGRFTLFSAIGPRFMPLPAECLDAAPRISSSDQRKQTTPKSIFLVMGASDPERQTVRLLRILTAMDHSFILNIVAGPQYSPLDILRDFCKIDARVKLHVVPDNFHALAATCDLAIIGAGLTVSELIHLQVPVAVLILADNQAPTADALVQKGLGVSLGRFDKVSDQSLSEELHRIISFPEKLEVMANKGRQTIDGQGATRLLAHLFAVWDKYQGKSFTSNEVVSEYRAAFAHAENYKKVLWGSSESMENRYLLALKILETVEGTSWLDVGSGTGDFLLTANRKGHKPKNYIGIDLSYELTEYARERCHHANEADPCFACQDFMSPVIGEPFALVTCLGVLQKCGVGLNLSVARMAELVQPGGRLLVSTKNLDWVAFDDPDCAPYPGHHWFKPAQLQNAFAKAGLQIVRFEGYEPRAGRLLPIKDAHSIFILATKANHD